MPSRLHNFLKRRKKTLAQTEAIDDGTMRTADGMPLKLALERALFRSRLRAVLLVLPLFAFLVITFVLPIFDMLFRSVEDQVIAEILPRTVVEIEAWDETSGVLPGEAVFEAIVKDMAEGKENKTLGKVARRLNYEISGMASLFRKSGRKAGKIEAPYKEQLLKIDKRWNNLELWKLIKREKGYFTASYFLAAADMEYKPDGGIGMRPENRQIYQHLFVRTLWLSGLITLLCLVLAYPVSYLLATLPLRSGNLLMILVLLPFWTSLLVRTTSWIALLQSQGVINSILVGIGIIDDDSRLQLIHNQFGTIVAMTHILLPFMILPLYSVMKTIPPSYMRAARSLGATPFTAFVRIYMPNTVAGAGAGGILVFILAIGYYITPALVGGRTGTLISNFIASFISGSTQNWGLAAALGMMLLAIVLVFYFLYDKIVGIDNMKLG